MASLRVKNIKVAWRHRKAMGDIDGLAACITSFGLLQPIAVTTDDKLVAGGRRLAAVKQLSGRNPGPCRNRPGLTPFAIFAPSATKISVAPR